MAIPAQGLTITWNSLPLQEVQELSITRDRGLPLGRITTWTPNLGTLEIAGFSTANLPDSDYGRRLRLKIEGRTAATSLAAPIVTFFESDCIYENARTQVIANDAVRFAFTFRIQDTLNAPSNP